MKSLTAFLVALLCASGAWGQSVTRPTGLTVPACGTPPDSGYATAGTSQPLIMDVNGNLCVGANITATATTTATAAATPTAVLAGTDKPLYINLFSALYTQPTYGSGVPVDLTHGLPVNVVDGGGTPPVDESAFTAGTTGVTTGGFFQTTATNNALTNGQAGSVQLTANRALFINLRNNAGAEIGVAAAPLQVSLANTAANATPVKVDNSAVTQPVSAASLPLPTGATTAANQVTANASLATIATNTGAATPAGTNTIGGVTLVASASAGLTPYHLPNGTSASNNATNIKSTPGNLGMIGVFNDGTGSATTINYLKVYDLASAPTCSSATGLKHVFPIPVSATVAGLIWNIALNETYANGIGFCVVGGSTDTDNSNAVTGIKVEAAYK